VAGLQEIKKRKGKEKRRKEKKSEVNRAERDHPP
jgi:hypothetical protein